MVTDDILFPSIHQIVQENGMDREEINESTDLMITDSDKDDEVFSERQSNAEFLNDSDVSHLRRMCSASQPLTKLKALVEIQHHKNSAKKKSKHAKRRMTSPQSSFYTFSKYRLSFSVP